MSSDVARQPSSARPASDAESNAVTKSTSRTGLPRSDSPTIEPSAPEATNAEAVLSAVVPSGDNALTPVTGASVGSMTEPGDSNASTQSLQSSVNLAVIHQAAHGEIDLPGYGRVSVDAKAHESGVEVRIVAGRTEAAELLLPHAIAMEAEVRAANIPLLRLEIGSEATSSATPQGTEYLASGHGEPGTPDRSGASSPDVDTDPKASPGTTSSAVQRPQVRIVL